MKKHIILIVLAAACTAQAQNTFLNDRLIGGDDVNGSARYVGMGGAMGALGADLSTISDNPAGIGLYRKNDVGVTFGMVKPNHKSATGTFDQIGIGWSSPMEGKLEFLNVAFNYQKKANLNNAYVASNGNLGGLSQMDQLAEMATAGYGTADNLTGLATIPQWDNTAMDNYYLQQDNAGYYNHVPSYGNQYVRSSAGSLQAYDFNVSFNISDRVYMGATFGMDVLDYRSWMTYEETTASGAFNYALYNDTEVSGYGLNGKLGVIVRPFEDRPVRLGLTMETPTWYRISNSTIYSLDASDEIESYLEYTLRTPWKMRLSAGSTVGNYLAWGVEYEFANYRSTRMGYPASDVFDMQDIALRGEKDQAMSDLTHNTLRGQHTLRLGLEARPVSPLALRIGYNIISSRYKQDVSFDQYSLDSYAMDYATGTEFMRFGATNILTFGAGYKWSHFYMDLAYKFRAQKADFYAFDTTGMQGSLTADKVNLNRHQLVLGLGFKF